MSALKKIAFVFAGVAAMALGAFGIIVPVLPTTPFLLLALYCFARGSKKLSCWFCGTWMYKKYLSEYVRTKSLPLKQKIVIQVCAGGMMIVSLFLIENAMLKALLVICLIIHNWIFIFKIKTRESDKSRKPRSQEVQNEI
jgi:Uncharacterized protein conserved in bacteria